MFKQYRKLFLVAALIGWISNDAFAVSYVPTPIEKMIQNSDLIVIGTVVNTESETDKSGIVWRRTTLEVNEVMKSKVGEIPRTIELTTGDGTTDYLVDFRPVFTVGKRVLSLMVERDGTYYGMGLRGKLDVAEDKIGGTSATVAEYRTAIGRIVENTSTDFDVEFPTDDQLKTREVGRAGKALTLYQGGAFNSSGNDHYDPPLNVTFNVNESDAVDEDDNAISCGDLKTALGQAVDYWNDVKDACQLFDCN